MNYSEARSVKNFRIVSEKLFRSGLPNGKDLSWIKYKYSINTVIDLTDRDRSVVKNWCYKNDVKYVKQPINEYNPSLHDFMAAINASKSNITLVHCFKGLHRTGAFCALYEIINNLKDKNFVLENLKKDYKNTHKELYKMVEEFLNGKL